MPFATVPPGSCRSGCATSPVGRHHRWVFYSLCQLSKLLDLSQHVGAGAAGLSAAYYLRTFVEENGVAVNITVFEKTDRIGGRTLTINPFGNSLQRVELGVSIFIKKNPKGIAVTT